MAITKTTQQPKVLRYTGASEVFYLPGTPGTTYTKGDLVTISAGVVTDITHGTDESHVIGRVVETVTTPSLATAFPKPADFVPGVTVDSTLVAVEVFCAEGTPVLLMNFDGEVDETVTSYTPATPVMVVGTGNGADDRSNTALIYVYSGPGAGSASIITDYDHGTLTYTLSRIFDTAVTSASSVISLAGEAAANGGCGLFQRIDLKDKNELHVADGAAGAGIVNADGDYIVFGGWDDIAKYVSKGLLPVVKVSAII